MIFWDRDVHWFNTVKISRSAFESSLGPRKVDQRARTFFVLGASMAALFDMAAVGEALLKLLEEWEVWSEGNSAGKGMVRVSRGHVSIESFLFALRE